MNKSAKIVVGILIIVVVIFIGYNAVKNQGQSDTIKIGIIAPLTGSSAFVGEGIRDAVLLAQKDIKNTKYQYEFVIEDDALDAKKTALAINKLISVDKVDAVVSFGSGTGNVVSPVTEQKKIIHFGIASDANIAKGNFNFIHFTPPSEEAKLMVDQLSKRGIKKIATFTLNQQGFLAITDSIKKNLTGTNIQLVSEQIFNTGDTDFRTIISKAKNNNPEILIIEGFSPEIDILAKQLKEAKISTPITTVNAFELSKQKDLFEGYWYVYTADPTVEFAKHFQDAYDNREITMGVSNTYDAISLIVAAAEKSDSKTKPSTSFIVNELMKVRDFKGALGNLTIDKDGIVISSPVVRMIKDGKPVSIPKL